MDTDVNMKLLQDIKVYYYYLLFIIIILGIFINGFLNGYGLKFNAGKYSYGKF